MPRPYEPDEDAWDDDPDAPQERDLDDADGDDDAGTISCPECGADVSELADRCPRCGNWISPDQVRPSRPRWVILGLILVLAIIATWVLLG